MHLNHNDFQDPKDARAFQDNPEWARYAMVVRLERYDDAVYTRTLNLLEETTPPGYEKHWRMMHSSIMSRTLIMEYAVFTWLGPLQLITAIKLADSTNCIGETIRVDQKPLWYAIEQEEARFNRLLTKLETLRGIDAHLRSINRPVRSSMLEEINSAALDRAKCMHQSSQMYRELFQATS